MHCDIPSANHVTVLLVLILPAKAKVMLLNNS